MIKPNFVSFVCILVAIPVVNCLSNRRGAKKFAENPTESI